ncbi:hypothetical protein GCM10025882_22380 [Acinetobacter gyllenbergii]|uniref:Uncharacterized protein n=1 Tax=Acinetobacter gyllenbergii CIP 110306 = MTCC 11365 TaxID=1217657 RepID=A0A829HE69_9GAMM|nr:hypothetical protein [Acinetobacter gyllenbergii]EPF71653.1 hypothetical protein F957_03839 [Acinetobacter gyllenbergii CIP 110306 = MTCC 11365]EPH31212.1 hypothetical protein L293_2362 [Acinetobacter gyllenbergii CIP 110306 = MTCC 11365]GMA11813.1 hypothetical protein GCM10025882_22380 [Acinetobacter gyllenbergii]
MKKRSITFTTGSAISANNFCLSANIDELDTWDYFSKIIIYKNLEQQKWSCLDLEGWKVISVAYQDRDGHPSIISLDQVGDVGIFQKNNNEHQEIRHKIEDKIYGQFNRIRIINGDLYACGDGSQVYKNNQNQWKPIGLEFIEAPLEVKKIDRSFLEDKYDLSFDRCIYDINGFDNNSIYICGVKSDEGFIAFFNGHEWVEAQTLTTSFLYGITLCPDETNVLISGQFGTLLKGNMYEGFKNLKDIHINSTFYGTAFYQEIIYIASEQGLYKYENSEYSIVPELSDLQGIIAVEEKEGALWILSHKYLVRFNGKTWDRINHPDNNAI